MIFRKIENRKKTVILKVYLFSDDLSVTRRRRRMARQLIPDETTAVLKQLLSPVETKNDDPVVDLEPVCEKHISFEEAKTPILRKKSSEENHIVSILKKNNPESGRFLSYFIENILLKMFPHRNMFLSSNLLFFSHGHANPLIKTRNPQETKQS